MQVFTMMNTRVHYDCTIPGGYTSHKSTMDAFAM